MIDFLATVIPMLFVGGPVVLWPALAIYGRRQTRKVEARAQALIDVGYRVGLQTAARVAERLPRPYITLSQGQGWDVAHQQHIDAIRARVEQELTGVTPARVTGDYVITGDPT